MEKKSKGVSEVKNVGDKIKKEEVKVAQKKIEGMELYQPKTELWINDKLHSSQG